MLINNILVHRLYLIAVLLCLPGLLIHKVIADDIIPDCAQNTGNCSTQDTDNSASDTLDISSFAIPEPTFSTIPAADIPSIPEKEDSESFFSILDDPQEYISSGVNGFTKTIDEFFSDEKVDYETNGSFIRLTADIVFSEGGNLGFVGDVKAKIELPNTKKKLKLVFESDPNEELNKLEPDLVGNPVDAAQDKSYFAGVEGVLGEFDYWKFRPGIGLKINSELEFFARFRANRTYNLDEYWNAYLSNTLYRFNTTGYGFETSLEFDRKIKNNHLFRSKTSAQWEEENDFWELSQVFSLTKSFCKKRALIYQAGIYGVSEPRVYSTDYVLQLRYRKLLHSNYLFLELSPKILYQREDDFEPQFSFTIRTEMVFKG